MSELLTITDTKDKSGCGMFSKFGRFSSEILCMSMKKKELINASKKRVFRVRQKKENISQDDPSEEDSLNGPIVQKDASTSPNKKFQQPPPKTAIERAAAEEEQAEEVAKQPSVGSAMKLTGRESHFYGRDFNLDKIPSPTKYHPKFLSK